MPQPVDIQDASPEAKRLMQDNWSFTTFLRKARPERAREAANHGLNDGTYNRQWGLDNDTIVAMSREGRAPTTLNFVKQKINTIAGSIIADRFQGDFGTEYGQPWAQAATIQELFLRDQNIGRWEGKIPRWMRDAFIYRGTMSLFLNTTIDPRGILDWEYIPPDRMIYDPNWMTTDVNDNNRVFEYTYKTKNRILEEFGDDAPWLHDAFGAMDNDPTSYANSPGFLLRAFDEYPDLRMNVDGLYLVINAFRLEKKTEPAIFDAMSGEYLDNIPPKERRGYLENWRLSGGSADGRHLSMVQRSRYVEKFATFCPGISLQHYLAEGDYPIQVNGYHFLPLSCDHLDGKPNTPTDQLGDPQRMVNKRMSTETFILATNGANGMAAEVSMFSTPEEYDRWVLEGHKPGYKAALAEGAIAKGQRFLEIPKQPAPTDFLNSTKSVLGITEQLTPAVPATQGQATSDTSGVLYQAQLNQALITMIVPKSFIKEGFHKMYEMYFEAAKDVYRYPIFLPATQSQHVFKVNYGTPDSIEIEEISRLKITINESPASTTKRSTTVREASVAMQYAEPGSLTHQLLSGIVSTNLTSIDDEQRNKLEQAAEVEAMVRFLELQVKAKGLQGQLQGSDGPPPDVPKISFSFASKDPVNPTMMAIAEANGVQMPARPAPQMGQPEQPAPQVPAGPIPQPQGA